VATCTAPVHTQSRTPSPCEVWNSAARHTSTSLKWWTTTTQLTTSQHLLYLLTWWVKMDPLIGQCSFRQYGRHHIITITITVTIAHITPIVINISGNFLEICRNTSKRTEVLISIIYFRNSLIFLSAVLKSSHSFNTVHKVKAWRSGKLFVKNVLILQHHIAMLDLRTFDYN